MKKTVKKYSLETAQEIQIGLFDQIYISNGWVIIISDRLSSRNIIEFLFYNLIIWINIIVVILLFWFIYFHF